MPRTKAIVSDSEKLRKLADWLDKKFPDEPNAEIQKDLRRIAVKLEYKNAISCPDLNCSSCENDNGSEGCIAYHKKVHLPLV